MLAAAAVWALNAVQNYSPPATSTIPGYLWVVNLLCAGSFVLVAFKRPKGEDL
jgi:hypothetical protein